MQCREKSWFWVLMDDKWKFTIKNFNRRLQGEQTNPYTNFSEKIVDVKTAGEGGKF